MSDLMMSNVFFKDYCRNAPHANECDAALVEVCGDADECEVNKGDPRLSKFVNDSNAQQQPAALQSNEVGWQSIFGSAPAGTGQNQVPASANQVQAPVGQQPQSVAPAAGSAAPEGCKDWQTTKPDGSCETEKKHRFGMDAGVTFGGFKVTGDQAKSRYPVGVGIGLYGLSLLGDIGANNIYVKYGVDARIIIPGERTNTLDQSVSDKPAGQIGAELMLGWRHKINKDWDFMAGVGVVAGASISDNGLDGGQDSYSATYFLARIKAELALRYGNFRFGGQFGVAPASDNIRGLENINQKCDGDKRCSSLDWISGGLFLGYDF